MKTFNKLLIIVVYMLLIAILVRIGFFAALGRMLLMRTSSGSTYLQAIVMSVALAGVLVLWGKMIKEGLVEEKHERN